MKKLLLYAILLLPALGTILTACGSDRGLVEEGLPAQVSISFSTPSVQQALRTALDEDQEKEIQSLALLVFNSAGTRELYQEYSQAELARLIYTADKGATQATDENGQPIYDNVLVSYETEETVVDGETIQSIKPDTERYENVPRMVPDEVYELDYFANGHDNGDGQGTGAVATFPLTTGYKHFVLIANYKGDNSIYEAIDPAAWDTYNKFLGEQAKQMTTQTVQRENGLLLMMGDHQITVRSSNQNISVPIKRMEARINFNLILNNGPAPASGDYTRITDFRAEYWRVGNVPKVIDAFAPENFAQNSAGITLGYTLPAADQAAFTNPQNFFTAAKASFETRTTDPQSGRDTYSFTFYMPANPQVAKDPIQTTDHHAWNTPEGRADYNLRQKQNKTANPASNGDNNLIPGVFNSSSAEANAAYTDFRYAPEQATYVEFTADITLEKRTGTQMTYSQAQVTYRIFLGYIGAQVNGNWKLLPCNDFSVHRNTNYTYNVTINDVNDLRVEARSDYHALEGEQEPAPGTSGSVADTKAQFVLDSHYEQGRVTFTKAQMGNLWNADGTPKQEASLSYLVNTPFDAQHYVTYTAAQLQEIHNALYYTSSTGLPEGKKVGDLKPLAQRTYPSWYTQPDDAWVTFYLHGSRNNDFLGNERSDNNYPERDGSGTDMQYFSFTEKELRCAGTTIGYYNPTVKYDENWRYCESVAELFYQILYNPTKAFNSAGECTLTFYVDEYFYDRIPTTPFDSRVASTKPQADLWPQFTNCPDRTMQLFLKERRISPDGFTVLYDQPALSISQMSIKTIFSTNPDEGTLVWGIENVDETQDLDFIWKGAGEAENLSNPYKTNPIINTWELLSYVVASGADQYKLSAGWTKTLARDPLRDGNTGNGPVNNKKLFPDRVGQLNGISGMEYQQLWTRMTRPKYGKLILDMGYWNTVNGNKNAYYAQFAPYIRNRDNNRDDMFQMRECKWLIPSSGQMALIAACNNALPDYMRMENGLGSNTSYTGYNYKRVYYTSTRFVGMAGGSLSSCNPIVFLPNGSALPLADYYTHYGSGYPSSPGFRQNNGQMRMIRILNKVEGDFDEVAMAASTYNSQHWMSKSDYFASERELYKEMGVQGGTTKDTYLKFRFPLVSDRYKRTTKITRGELPTHDQYSSVNRIYRGGFEVAKWPAYKYTESGVYTTNPTAQNNTAAKYYVANWTQLQQDIKQGKSPCAKYAQEASHADQGTWRVPNMAELQIMAFYLYDWHSTEGDRIYQNNNYWWSDYSQGASGTIGTYIFSNTGYNAAARANAACYFLALNGYNRQIALDENYQNAMPSNLNRARMMRANVRCVRDID